MKKPTLIPAICILAVLAASPVTAASNQSVDGLALMKVEHDARAAGMGGAFVSETASANATFYNPAAAYGVDGFMTSLGHTSYWENIRIESGFFAGKLKPKWAVHGGIRFAGVDNLQARTRPTTVPDAIFEARDLSFKAGLAYRASNDITVGVAAGWFLEKIEARRGSAFNVDLGLQYRLNQSTRLGASITNLGSSFKLSKTGEISSRDISLPTTYRWGGRYSFDRYLLASDIVIVDDEFHLHLGAEVNLHEILYARAGYMANYDAKNFTAGLSFVHDIVTVDYAFVPYAHNLGTSHLFSLTFNF